MGLDFIFIRAFPAGRAIRSICAEKAQDAAAIANAVGKLTNETET